MKYGVHALREFTCSEHKVTTHEPKASKQIRVICNALSSELGIHQRDLEGCRKPRGRRRACAAGHCGGEGEDSRSTGHSQGLTQVWLFD